MLGLFIVLYGLKGLYLHDVPVWMGQKGSRLRDICTSLRGGWGQISSEQVPEAVPVDVLNTVKMF